jgi:RIO-like serine/threonine protein kinase
MELINLNLKKYLLAGILFSQSPLFASLLPYNSSLPTNSTSLFCLNPKSEIIWEKSEEKVKSYNPFLINLTSNQMRIFSLLNKISEKKHKKNKKKTTYSKTTISDMTLKLLSEKSQEGLKKYGSYIDEEGSIYKDFENIMSCGDFIVDKSKYLGCGDEGCVYLAQHKTKKYFVAAKHTDIYHIQRIRKPNAYTYQGREIDEISFNILATEEDFISVKVKTLEHKNLKFLGRLRGIHETSKYNGYLFQDLVDGVTLNWLGNSRGLFPDRLENFFGKNFDYHDRAHLSKNLLKEFIFVYEKKAISGEISSGHIMVEKDLTVRFIDFSRIYEFNPSTPLKDVLGKCNFALFKGILVRGFL